MRPVATEQDPHRFPLNHLLGTAAHVRLLRVLSTEVAGPISPPDAAKRAGLTDAGARRALGRLSKTGFVRRVGGGRSQQFALREDDQLAEQLIALFRREANRYGDLLGGIRAILRDLPDVGLAWIDSPPCRFGEPLHIGVVSDSESLSSVSAEVRLRIAPIEESFDVTIEVHNFSRADAPVLDWDTVTLLAGIPPVDTGSARAKPPSHTDRDLRALRLSQAILRLLNHDPSLARRAARHVERLLDDDQGAAAHDLRAWHTILAQYSHGRLLDFLVSDTPRAQRLRQSSPFFAVLTAEERDEVLQGLEGGS